MAHGGLLSSIIFDLDGTLVCGPYDFAAMRAAIREIAAGFGVSKDIIADAGVLEAIAAGAKSLGEPARAQFRAKAEAAVLQLEAAAAQEAKPIAGAKETLAGLRAEGLKVGIITRNSQKVVEGLLGRVEFPHDVLLARESATRVKPHPGHLEQTLAALGCLAEEALVVGDHIWDMQAGQAAGLRCVGVATGTSSYEELCEAGAEAVLESVAELPVWLAERFSFPGRK